MGSDFIIASALLSLAGVISFVYYVRVKIRGRHTNERVDAYGGSSLLNKGMIEGAYWFLQPFSRLLAYMHITPNKISFASLFFGILAGGCLVVGHFGSAAVFAILSALLDSLDGQVARLNGLSSNAGEIVDAAIDRYVEFFFLAGLVLYYREIPALQALALFALLGSFMISYSSAKAEAMGIEPPKTNMRRAERGIYLIIGAALSPITIPWLEKVREYPIAVAHPMVIALAMVAVLGNVSAVERLYAIYSGVKKRDQKAIEAKRAQRPLVQVEGSQGMTDEENAQHSYKPS